MKPETSIFFLLKEASQHITTFSSFRRIPWDSNGLLHGQLNMLAVTFLFNKQCSRFEILQQQQQQQKVGVTVVPERRNMKSILVQGLHNFMH